MMLDTEIRKNAILMWVAGATLPAPVFRILSRQLLKVLVKIEGIWDNFFYVEMFC